MFKAGSIVGEVILNISSFRASVRQVLSDQASITQGMRASEKAAVTSATSMSEAAKTTAKSSTEAVRATGEMTSAAKTAASATNAWRQSAISLSDPLNRIGKEAVQVSAATSSVTATSTAAARAVSGFRQSALSLADPLNRIGKEATQASVAIQTFGQRARAQLASVAASARAMGASLAASFETFSRGALGLTVAGAALTGFALSTVKAAAHVEELDNMFTVSMGDMADSARTWAEEVSTATGIADFEIRGMVGQIDNIVKAMGFSEKAAFAMSKNLAMLSVDIASFDETTPEEAFTRIMSGMLGETESVRKFGALVDELNTKNFALAHGIGEVGRELTSGEKIMARYGIIMEATKVRQTDMIRSNESLTNQMRRAQGSMSMLSVALGQQLLPVMTSVIRTVNYVLAGTLLWTKENPKLAAGIMLVVSAAGIVVAALAAIGWTAPLVVGGFGAIATAAAIAWAAMLSGPALVVASLAAIVISAKVLYDQFNISFPGAAKAVGDFVDWSIGKLDALLKTAGSVITWAKTVGSAVSDALGTSMDMNGNTQYTEKAKTAGETTAKYFGGALLDSLKNYVATGSEMLNGVLGRVGSAVGVEGIKKQLGNLLAYDPADVKQLLEDFENTIGNGGGNAAKAAEKLRDAGEALFRSLRKDVDLIATATEALDGLKAAGKLDDATLNLLGADFWRKFGSAATGQIDAAIAGMQAMGGQMATIAAAMRTAQEQARIDELKPQGIALDLKLNPQADAFQQVKHDLEALAAAEKLTGENALAMGKALWDSVGKIDSGQLDALLEKISGLNSGDAVVQGAQDAQAGALSAEFDAIMNRVDPLSAALERIREELETIQKVDMTEGQGSLFGEEIFRNLSDLGLTTAEQMKQAIGVELPDIIKEGMESLENDAKKAKQQLAMRDVVQGFGELGSAISSIGGKFKVVGAVIQGVKSVIGAVGAAMNLLALISAVASTAVRLSWETALGIFGYILEVITQIINGIMAIVGATGQGTKELKGMAKVMDEIKQASEEWINSITDALLDFAKEGKAAWGELVQQILDDIFKIAAAELLVKPIVNFGGGLLGFAKGGAFEHGNVVPFANGGIVSSPSNFPMAGGKKGLMGEAGPEAIVPLDRMMDGKLGIRADIRSDSGLVVQINDHRQHGEPVQVRETRTADGRRQLEVIILDAIARAARNGDLDATMQSRYGLQGRAA